MTLGPDINDRYPIQESLSPPEIARPVYECAQAVYVTGFLAHALVRVYANGNDLLAETEPPFGFATITLRRAVAAGEVLTAQQVVAGQRSQHSLQPVTVEPLDGNRIRTTQPVIAAPVYECGIVVPVGNLVPSTQVHVTENGGQIGAMAAAQPYHPVVTAPLHAGSSVRAAAIACEGTDHEVRGPESGAVTPLAAPVPPPAPRVDAATLIPGNDAVTLTGLLVGAAVEIFDNGVSVSSGWYATADANYFPLQRRLSNTPITARQQLCGNVSPESAPETPRAKLRAPQVVGPICAGARHVVVRGSVINAAVVVLRNGSPMTHGGAAPGDLILALGQGAQLAAGDVISAVQYMNGTLSPVSNTVTVSSGLEAPVIEIDGGHPFFAPAPGEQAIAGGVFPRGRGGPRIRIQACCRDRVVAWLTGPGGEHVADLAPAQLYPGYYTAAWDWQNQAGWAVPAGIPVGEYQVHVRSACQDREGRASFFVIFDPDAAGGPARFAFDPAAVWFGSGTNSIQGLHYYLRCSDWRVFRIAITAAARAVDPYTAAVAVARAEESLFGYSLSYHTQDVLDLITNYSETQCADDAACLTALLRAIGVPAHPVTADAALETGAADWTFDTWIEFLAAHGGAPQWWALHPHQYPGMAPETRAQFGVRGVASKSFNDLIVMANENWIFAQLDDGASDVTYSRNECREPQQSIAKASWIDELCEAGYWSQPHWDCAGVRTRSLAPGNGFRITDGEPVYGGRIVGTVELVNAETARVFGSAAVDLVVHRIEEKGFDRVIGTARREIAVDPDDAVELEFEFDLPSTLAPGENLYLRARLDRRTALIRHLRLPQTLTAEIDLPGEWGVGEEHTVPILLENRGDDTVTGLTLELLAPYALHIEALDNRIPDLESGARVELSARVRAIAPLPSGSVHIAIASRNAGAVLLRRPFQVRADATGEVMVSVRPD
ncbi:transglutaminase domain-containing protein [Nocardia inohanensis]|uniref:transglutaminase domain-containing protein n=1 Tax=Nocardia inohanensis TaxID=209246 RepID=UPI00082B752A|nr:transglutaminase domain-containing protein [Nocardia inohanensis]